VKQPSLMATHSSEPTLNRKVPFVVSIFSIPSAQRATVFYWQE
jgi:hypothetical protein